MTWRDEAVCADAVYRDLFVIPETRSYTHARARQAKNVCQLQCPVRVECLIFAMQMNDQHGILGGLTPSERRKLTPEAFERITGQPWSATLPR